ncbi:MAG: VOC family protein [Nostoc sp.]|uniref:VOC family protein n=1 Tax=Nostoc sp. TaxID=1180 RepID=UPI002FF48BF2
MSSINVDSKNMKLEVLTLPVSDVDQSKRFYESLGWRLDADFITGEDFRVVQLTPPSSECSIIIGTGITSAVPGSVQGLHLVVFDIEAARAELVDRGVEVSEVFHDIGGIFHHAGTEGRVSGPDPKRRDYASFASFSDPDGNGWVLQEVKTRAPGRVWNSTPAGDIDVATLANLLRETAEHHDHYEKTHAEHHWSDWYAPYLSARQNGSSSKEAAVAADRYMEEAFPVFSR